LRRGFGFSHRGALLLRGGHCLSLLGPSSLRGRLGFRRHGSFLLGVGLHACRGTLGLGAFGAPAPGLDCLPRVLKPRLMLGMQYRQIARKPHRLGGTLIALHRQRIVPGTELPQPLEQNVAHWQRRRQGRCRSFYLRSSSARQSQGGVLGVQQRTDGWNGFAACSLRSSSQTFSRSIRS
jgi:hypothetical protein